MDQTEYDYIKAIQTEVWNVLYSQYYREVGELELPDEVALMIQAAFDNGRDAAPSVPLSNQLEDVRVERDALRVDVSDLTEELAAAETLIKQLKIERDDVRANIQDLIAWLDRKMHEEIHGDAHYAHVLGYVERMSGQ